MNVKIMNQEFLKLKEPIYNYTEKAVQLRELYFGPQNQKILLTDQCYGMVHRTIRV